MAVESKTITQQKINKEPLWFITDILGCGLWLKQREIIESVKNNRSTSVKSCHASGKTYTAADAVLWFLFAYLPSIVITTAPTMRQVKEILWSQIRANHRQAKIPLGGDALTTKLVIDDNWYALGLSTNEPEKFHGFHSQHLLVIVDEASGVPQEVFDGLQGSLSTGFVRLLYISNPTQLAGAFFDSFKSTNFNNISISAFETPNFTKFGITIEDIRDNSFKDKIKGKLPYPMLITPDWVRERLEEWGEESPLFQVKVLGQFPDAATDALIPLHLIEQAIIREIEATEPVEVGADIARFGEDSSVFATRRGSKLLPLEKHIKEDTMQTTGRIGNLIGLVGPRVAKVDSIGVGAGVVDRLAEQGRPVEGINVGEASNFPEKFLNKRAEFYWNLRERFYSGDIDIPDDSELIGQLANIKYEFTSRGQIKIQSKEDMKKEGLKSPDCADAIMLAFAICEKGMAWLDYSKDELSGPLPHTNEYSLSELLKNSRVMGG